MLVNANNNSWYYRIAYFFIANQVVFKRLLIVLLILLNIVIWVAVGLTSVNYLSHTSNQKRLLEELTQNQIDWLTYHEKNKPQDLKIVSIHQIKVSHNKYDLVAKISNPNKDWLVNKFDYTFEIDNYPTDWQSGFILPNENKYLFYFSHLSNTMSNKIELKIDKISWQRINIKDKIPILENIQIKDKIFSESSNLGQLKFEATNNTPYSFWQIGWQIVLYQAEKPVAVNYVTTNNFLSGQTKNVSAVWSEKIGSVSKIEILPEVNVFDNSNLILQSDLPPVNLIKGAQTQKE